MKVIVVEDEPQAAARMKSLLHELQPEWEIVQTFDSVKRAVEYFKSPHVCDLVFMDIQLADGLSFEIFEKVSVNEPVIFTTAYNEYALKAFKVNSIDYLLKPVDKEELSVAIRKYKSLSTREKPNNNMMESIAAAMQMLTKRYKERFMVKVGEHLRSLEVGDILFFFSLEKTTFAQTRDGRKHILDFTLEQLEEIIDPAKFFRINRKYLVSVNAIQDMINHTNSRLKLILKTSDDKDVIVARERVQKFKEWMDR
jgi:DNA-binding LytR/AlgR family response regulator